MLRRLVSSCVSVGLKRGANGRSSQMSVPKQVKRVRSLNPDKLHQSAVSLGASKSPGMKADKLGNAFSLGLPLTSGWAAGAALSREPLPGTFSGSVIPEGSVTEGDLYARDSRALRYTSSFAAGGPSKEEAGEQLMKEKCARAEPAVVVLDVDNPEDQLTPDLKASGSYMLNVKQGLPESGESGILQREDFSAKYIEYLEHPDDYVLTDKPVWEVTHQRNRTILRTCFKVDGGKYLPFSAVLDSEAPKPMCLSHKLYDLLLEHNRIKELAVGADGVVIGGRAFLVGVTPARHQPRNLIGRRLLSELGWGMHEDDQGKQYDTFDKKMMF